MDRAIAYALAEMDYTELYPYQEEVVKEFLSGKDVFVSFPTGSGKSLCYCILPLAFDFMRREKANSEARNETASSVCAPSKSIVVVVSPLVVLMKDQVQSAKDRNIPSLYAGEMDENTKIEACKGNHQLIFISPEGLMSSLWWRDVFLSPIYQKNLVGFVVDDAHCVVKW